MDKIQNAKGYHLISSASSIKNVQDPSKLVIDCSDNLDNVITSLKTTTNTIRSFNDIGASNYVAGKEYLQQFVYGPAPEPTTGYIEMPTVLYGPAPYTPEPIPEVYGPAPYVPEPIPEVYGPAPYDPEPVIVLYGPAPEPVTPTTPKPIIVTEPPTKHPPTPPYEIKTTPKTSAPVVYDSPTNPPVSNNVSVQYHEPVQYNPPVMDSVTSTTPPTMPPESLNDEVILGGSSLKSNGIESIISNHELVSRSMPAATNEATSNSSKDNNKPTVIAMSGAGVLGAAAVGAMTIKAKKDRNEDAEDYEEEDSEEE